MKKKTNTWSGPNALKEFLMPGSYMTPLVELPRALNPLAKKGVRIYAKLLYLLPLLNVKSLMASSMLEAARKAGALKGVHTVVENSSGNTGISLAIDAKYHGVKNVVAIVLSETAPGKVELLRLAGADIRFVKGGGIALARKLGKQKGFLNLAQYENDTNPKTHENVTAPEIWEQTDGAITLFAAGLGTTGTAVGAARFFRKRNVSTLGIYLDPESAIPGVRTAKGLKEIRFDWRKEIDFSIEVATKESYRKSLALARAGILGGPSSGLALAGLLKFLGGLSGPQLNELRNADDKVVAVFPCPDTAMPYLDKYSTFTDPHEF